MALIIPSLELKIQSTPNGMDEFILKSEANFDGINYISSGHQPIPSNLDSNNVLQIGLLISEEIAGSNTIQHSINLGPLDFGISDFLIEVSIYNQQNSIVAKGDIRNTTAKKMGKPID